jgi:hypothetical protein
VSVADVKYSPPSLSKSKIEISAVTVANEKVKIDIRGKAPVQVGVFSIDITLKAEGALWHNANVRLNGVVRQEVSIPDITYLGFLTSSNSSDKDVDFLCPADFLANNPIDKIVVLNGLPDILNVKLVRDPLPHLQFSLKHTGEVRTFSHDVEIEVYFLNGKKYLLSTNVTARLL